MGGEGRGGNEREGIGWDGRKGRDGVGGKRRRRE